MRDIKFRALELDTGVMRFGSYIAEDGVSGIDGENVTRHKIFDGLHHEIAEETLGQYTGLKAEDGVEIYEGDIIPYGGNNYAVEMCGPSWSFPEFVGQDYYGHDEPELQDWPEFEVIGNIHQNPELLGD